MANSIDRKARFEEMVSFAKNVISSALPLSDNIKQRLAKMFEDYMEGAPEEEKNHMYVVFVNDENGNSKSIAVRKADVPKKLLEDDEFFKLYLKMLAS